MTERGVRLVTLRAPSADGTGDAIRAQSIRAALEDAGVQVRTLSALEPGEGLGRAALRPGVLRHVGSLLAGGGWRQPLQCLVVEALLRDKGIAAGRSDELSVFVTSRVVPHAVEGDFVVDFVDSLASNMRSRAAASRAPLRWFWGWEARRLRAWEAEVAARAVASAAVSDEEAALIGPDVEGVALEVAVRHVPRDERGTPYVIFPGSLFYAPNAEAVTWIAHELVPALVALGWDPARVVVAGRRPSAALTGLVESAGITLRPDVDDLIALIAGARVSLAPIVLGSGVQTKVLNTLAVGTPVVMTPRANRGLGLRAGPSVRILERDPQAWAQAVADLTEREPGRELDEEAQMVLLRSSPDQVRSRWRALILPWVGQP